MEIWKQDLSQALQKGRENMDLTQQELAEMIQKSTGAVGQFERGESLPSLDTLYLLIKCLGIEANDLFPSLSSTPSYFDEMKAIMRNLGQHRTNSAKNVCLVAIDKKHSPPLIFLRRGKPN